MNPKITAKYIVDRIESSEKHTIGRVEVVDTKLESIERELHGELRNVKNLTYATLIVSMALLGFLVGLMVKYFGI